MEGSHTVKIIQERYLDFVSSFEKVREFESCGYMIVVVKDEFGNEMGFKMGKAPEKQTPVKEWVPFPLMTSEEIAQETLKREQAAREHAEQTIRMFQRMLRDQ